MEVQHLDIVDSWFGTHGLALSASPFVIAVKWFMDKKIIIHEANLNSRVKLPYWVLTMIKIALPTLTISQGY